MAVARLRAGCVPEAYQVSRALTRWPQAHSGLSIQEGYFGVLFFKSWHRQGGSYGLLLFFLISFRHSLLDAEMFLRGQINPCIFESASLYGFPKGKRIFHASHERQH